MGQKLNKYISFTQEQRLKIKEMLDKKFTSAEIADHFGVTVNNIRDHIKVNGGNALNYDPYNVLVPSKSLITFKEREEIERLLSLGYSINQVGFCLKRHPSSIRYEIDRGGGKEKYTAEKGQGIVRNILIPKSLNSEEKEIINNICEDIRTIFMQLEILYEKVKR